MLFSDTAPFIRFAEIIHFESPGATVFVRDCRIFCILSGTAQITIDGQSYVLAPHTVFYCCGGSQYTIRSQGIDLIAVNFDLTQDHREQELPYAPIPVSGEKPLPTGNVSFIQDQPEFNRHIFLENGLACREQLEAILREFTTKRILYRETAGALLKEALSRMLRSLVEAVSPGAKTVERIMEHIRLHYSQPITNATFSRLFGYHEYYLNRLFAIHTGSTIHQYILDVRISHAKKLLLNTDMTLSAIGEAVGFRSNTYFSSYFRQATGLSPSQFRKVNKNSI